MTTPDLQHRPTGSDRRSEMRLDEQATVFVECLAADPDSTEPGSIVLCQAKDVSASGLQVFMDQPVPIGSILRLCTHFREGADDLFLVGEVRWLRQEVEGYWIGFQLYDSDQTDIVSWKHALADKLSDG